VHAAARELEAHSPVSAPALPQIASAEAQVARTAWVDRGLAAVAALGTAVLATVQSGRIHPDEVYQFLEPANHVAFHFGVLSWEWHQGVRNWVVPAALAAGMKLFDALGGTSALGHRLGAALVVALLGYPGFRALLGYAERRTQSALAARLGFALVLLWSTSLYFLGRTLGEPMGVLCGIAAIGALDGEDRPLRRGLLAGLWLGLAVVVRYGFATLVVAVLVQTLIERRWRALLGALASGAGVALLLGVLDWLSWGKPWKSIFEYVRFNLGGGAARMFGTKPWWFYLEVCLTWAPWPLLLAAPKLRLRQDRMLLPALAYLLALSATAYKVDRFVFPVLLLLVAALAPAAGAWLVELWSSGRARRAAAVLAGAGYLALSAWSYSRLPDLESDLFRATMQVGRDPALRQLIVVNESIWGSGGNFYVGRDLRVYYTGPGYPGYIQVMRNPNVNRAVVFRSPKDQRDLERFGFQQVGAVGETTILAR